VRGDPATSWQRRDGDLFKAAHTDTFQGSENVIAVGNDAGAVIGVQIEDRDLAIFASLISLEIRVTGDKDIEAEPIGFTEEISVSQ